jgi:hypothetical protein
MPAYILLNIEVPADDAPPTDTQAWRSFEAKADRIPLRSEQSQRLSKNAWLLDRQSESLPFAQLLTAAEACRLPWRVRYLHGED